MISGVDKSRTSLTRPSSASRSARASFRRAPLPGAPMAIRMRPVSQASPPQASPQRIHMISRLSSTLRKATGEMSGEHQQTFFFRGLQSATLLAITPLAEE